MVDIHVCVKNGASDLHLNSHLGVQTDTLTNCGTVQFYRSLMHERIRGTYNLLYKNKVTEFGK